MEKLAKDQSFAKELSAVIVAALVRGVIESPSTYLSPLLWLARKATGNIPATNEEAIRFGKDSAFRNHLKKLSPTSFLTILIVIVVLALASPGEDLIQKIDAAKNALGLPVSGCMDPTAENYNRYATSQTEVTCTYPKAQAK